MTDRMLVICSNHLYYIMSAARFYSLDVSNVNILTLTMHVHLQNHSLMYSIKCLNDYIYLEMLILNNLFSN